MQCHCSHPSSWGNLGQRDSHHRGCSPSIQHKASLPALELNLIKRLRTVNTYGHFSKAGSFSIQQIKFSVSFWSASRRVLLNVPAFMSCLRLVCSLLQNWLVFFLFIFFFFFSSQLFVSEHSLCRVPEPSGAKPWQYDVPPQNDLGESRGKSWLLHLPAFSPLRKSPPKPTRDKL